MKKTIALLLAVLLLLGLAACGGKTAGPEDTVKKFCDAMKSWDLKTMADCMADGGDQLDLNDLLGTEEEDALGASLLDFLKASLGKLNYTITGTDTQEDKSTVSVRFDYPDIAPVISQAFTDYFSQALALAFSGAEDAEIEALFQTVFEKARNEVTPETVQTTVDLACVKTDAGWKIQEPSDALLDVLTCNMESGLDGLEDFD